MAAALIFPGQGAQSVGMQSELAAAFPVVRETYAEAGDALSFDLWKLVSEGPAEELDRTENTQPALLTAGVAVWRVLSGQTEAVPEAVAGHSLGEYTALAAAGALDFATAVRLVATRGRLMQEAVPAGAGAMAVVLGLDDGAVRELCRAAADGEVVEAVNFNAPGQVAIAGTAAGIERAIAAAKEAGARRAMALSVSVPSHCALMRPAAEELAEVLAQTDIASPRFRLINNVDVASPDDPDEIRAALVRQLYNPVRWVETAVALANAAPGGFIESGPGNVLSGLQKRIDRSVSTLAISNSESVDKAVAMLEQDCKR